MVTEKPQANKPLFITKEFEFVLLLYYALKYATIIDHTRGHSQKNGVNNISIKSKYL